MDEKSQEYLTIRLKDGRKLGYAEYGNPNGKTVFHFHGFPGCRLEAGLVSDKLTNENIRFISIDRPGMGLSDFKVGRTILDWPDDVIELADALGIDKFAVEGISGGGPYAAACAFKIPYRLTAVAIVAGVGPLGSLDEIPKSTRRLFFIVKRFYWIFKLITKIQAKSAQNLEKSKKSFQKTIQNLPEPDRLLLSNPELLHRFVEQGAETFRQGGKGIALDGKLYTQDWGFRLAEIHPNVNASIWHGELDGNVPVSMGKAMCNAIPNCKGTFYPNDGHYSIAFNHINEIIEHLTSY